MLRLATILLFCLVATPVAAQDFLTEQKRYPRVRTALAEKDQAVAADLAEKGVKTDDLRVLIIAYKTEKTLLIYARNT